MAHDHPERLQERLKAESKEIEAVSFQPDTIYCGDCKEVLKHFPEGCVDLIYLDPPFFSNEKYEVIWNDTYEVRAYEDRWKGGINNYIAWMKERLQECHRVLKDTGSIYLHCDWHADAHLRILMDDVFGENNFRNEIVWHYRKWSAGWKQFQRNHDVLLFYSKTDSDKRTFTKRFMGRAPSTLKRFGDARIISGHDEEGKRVPSQMAKESSVGVPLDDVWDIGRVPPIKQLYPTQKPEPLLERIIDVSSNPTDIVLDPFCGCGTAILMAHKMGRRWIGIDVSPTACRLMRVRMVAKGAKSAMIIGMPKTLEDLKKLQPFEFQNWVNEKLYARPNPKKSGDMGIDGFYLDGTPIQVKQSEGVGRNVVDNFETAIKRDGKTKGMVVAFSFGKGAYEEVARVRLEEGLEIILKTVEEILKET